MKVNEISTAKKSFSTPEMIRDVTEFFAKERKSLQTRERKEKKLLQAQQNYIQRRAVCL